MERLHALAAARGPGRHRPHAAATTRRRSIGRSRRAQRRPGSRVSLGRSRPTERARRAARVRTRSASAFQHSMWSAPGTRRSSVTCPGSSSAERRGWWRSARSRPPSPWNTRNGHARRTRPCPRGSRASSQSTSKRDAAIHFAVGGERGRERYARRAATLARGVVVHGLGEVEHRRVEHDGRGHRSARSRALQERHRSCRRPSNRRRARRRSALRPGRAAPRLQVLPLGEAVPEQAARVLGRTGVVAVGDRERRDTRPPRAPEATRTLSRRDIELPWTTIDPRRRGRVAGDEPRRVRARGRRRTTTSRHLTPADRAVLRTTRGSSSAPSPSSRRLAPAIGMNARVPRRALAALDDPADLPVPSVPPEPAQAVDVDGAARRPVTSSSIVADPPASSRVTATIHGESG